MNIKKVPSKVFAKISAQFKVRWAAQKGDCPRVEYVFSITNTSLKKRWDDYREGLQIKSVEEQYHGTILSCDIIHTKLLCADPTCGICGISRFGFDPGRIRTNIRFQRLGHCFYLACNSSKCHDYTQSTGGYHDYRAMLLCEVCPGKKFICTKNNTRLKNPPPGFDSVYGMPGGDLNYEEIGLFKSDAILPKYIIMYRKDGTCRLIT